MRPEDIVAKARLWIGTPYRHQASCRGAGSDCLGLVTGVWREICGALPVAIPHYTADWSEPSRDETLLRTARAALREIGADQARPGDIVLFRMRDGAVAKHLGILAGTEPRPSFVHAYVGHGVVESPLSVPWRRRIVAYFRFPEMG